MAKLVWDKTGERYYETGVNRGVLYPQDSHGKYPKGVVWNGLTAVTKSPGGAEASDYYADNIKYASIRSAETYGATIEAYTYPDEFAACDGSAEITQGVMIGQQSRKPFGFAYRTLIGNDTASEEDDGYKLHLVYNSTASPSEKAYQTINESPEAITFSWEITTTPVDISGYKPRVIDEYVESPMTATWFGKDGGGRKTNEIVTAKIIYYQMFALNIPLECQKWHLNRLLTLIRVCNIKNTPPKKIGRKELMRRNAALNASRRKSINSKG